MRPPPTDGGRPNTPKEVSITLVSRRVLSKKSTTFLRSCSTGMAHQARDCERSRAPSDRRSPRAGPCRSRVQISQSPRTIEDALTYDVVISAPNPDMLLKPGMTATIRIVVDRRDDVLRAPDQTSLGKGP